MKTNMLSYLKSRVSFIETVITEEGYLAANSAIWEFYAELKLKLKDDPKTIDTKNDPLVPLKVPKVLTTDVKKAITSQPKGNLEVPTTDKKKEPFIPPRGNPVALTEMEKGKIKKLVQEGGKPVFISTSLNLPYGTVYYWVTKYRDELGITEGAGK